MNYTSLVESGVEICQTLFQPTEGIAECYAIFQIVDNSMDFMEQIRALNQSVEQLILLNQHLYQPIGARFFASDIANQESLIHQICSLSCPYSVVGQSPLDGSKIALWLWMSGESSHHKQLYIADMKSSQDGSYLQTSEILDTYELQLEQNGCTLSGNCIRTWFFVHDVDTNYSGVVQGRKANFDVQHLTKDTHYIASTGIEAKSNDGKTLVKMDSYAVSPLQPGQMSYLYASSHMNPTYEYGVTFERGTALVYGDRTHVFISGTASIDHTGAILYEGDIKKQTFRVWENVEALLNEAHCDYGQVNYMIVYLRDLSDYSLVKGLYDERFPDIPCLILQAPVCRPGWLIEMECMATLPSGNCNYPVF